MYNGLGDQQGLTDRMQYTPSSKCLLPSSVQHMKMASVMHEEEKEGDEGDMMDDARRRKQRS